MVINNAFCMPFISVFKYMPVYRLTIMLLFIAIRCNNGPLSPDAYMAWLNNPSNNLQVVENGDLFEYKIKYHPFEELILNEVGTQCTASVLDSLSLEYKALEYYSLKISSSEKLNDVIKTGLTQESEYYERLSYLSYSFQSDIAMVVNQDTSMCALYHFERSYGATPYLQIMLGFENTDSAKAMDRKILIYSRMEPEPTLFTFNLRKESIQNIPKLEF